MKQKQTILIVLGLASITVVATFLSRRGMSFSSFGERMLYPVSEPELMETQVAPTYVDGVGGSAGEMGVSKGMVEDYSTSIMPMYYPDNALHVTERMIEKTSYHGVVVKDVSAYMSEMKEYLTGLGGVILNSSVETNNKYTSGSLTVEVPTDRFDEVVTRVTQGVKKVVSESVNAYDITGQVDGSQQQLQLLLDEKALKQAQLKDATTEVAKAKIEIEIARLDRQIAFAQSAVDTQKERVAYSSVTVTAADNEKYFNYDASGDISYEFSRAWESLKNTVKVAALFGVWLVVYSIVWLPVVLIVKAIINRLKA